MSEKGRNVLGVIGGFFFFLLFRISSWLCSLPAWITLILHFTLGLSIWWFWGTLAAWILAGLIRYLLIVFARWGARSSTRVNENVNPYSVRGNPYDNPEEKK
ncbi:MAG: hypothetical protein II797_01960 [Clostridia bacterium]|nr:hypothetical protein [Clostridia bacterium]